MKTTEKKDHNIVKRKVGRPKGAKSPSKWNEVALHKLGKEIIKMAKEDGVWHITEFAERHEHTDKWMYAIADKYDIFEQYLTRARRILGRKMFKYGMEKNPNVWMLKTFMPRFLGEQEEVNFALATERLIEAQAKIKALEGASKEVKILLHDLAK